MVLCDTFSGKARHWSLRDTATRIEQAEPERSLWKAESEVYAELRTAKSSGYPVSPVKTLRDFLRRFLTANTIASQAVTTVEHWLAAISDSVVWFRTHRGETHA